MKEAFTVLAFVTGLAIGGAQESTVLGLSAKPAAGRIATPIAVTATGKGLCGAVHIDWGDGTAITYPTSTLPVTQSHQYQYGGSYTVRAQGMGNCSGQATTAVRIEGPPPPPPPTPPPAPAPPAPPRKTDGPAISGIEISTPRDAGPNLRAIRVEGAGTCAYTLDFGDGNTEGRNAPLPDVVRHNYPAQGRYTITATPAAPCTGSGRSTIVVGGAAAGSIEKIEVRPDARVGAEVVAIVQGSGQCRITVDFDDDTQREVTGTLPARVTHRYDRRGAYEIVAWAERPCTGGGSATIRVR